MDKSGYVYIMTNKSKTTLYIGVTSNLVKRITEHKNHIFSNSFTDRYNLEHCIYYEEFPDIGLAIKREKELKKWNRQKKVDLINSKNAEWKILVTEKGFVREKKLYANQVSDLVNELLQKGKTPTSAESEQKLINEQIPSLGRNDNASVHKGQIPPSSRNDNASMHKQQIPPSGRNDGSKGEEKVVCGGGGATSAYDPTPQKASVISSEARNLNPNRNEGHGSEGRNLNFSTNEGHGSKARNLNLSE